MKVLKGSFRDACDVYGFIKYNPARDLRLPRFDKRREDIKHLYTQKEIDLILNKFSDNDTFTCVFLTSCYTGMRTGEVCGLTWDDIDFEKETINIQHNVYDKPKDGKGRWYIGTTKTETGTRKIHLSQTLKIALQNYKKKQDYFKKIYGRRYIYYNVEDVKNQSGKVVEHRIVREELSNKDSKKINLIFMRENGLYLGTDITRIPFKIIHNELGIKKCRFYDLRGSFATISLRGGCEIKDIAEVLGHKRIETTEKYYISSTSEDKKEVGEIFEMNIKLENKNDIIINNKGGKNNGFKL